MTLPLRTLGEVSSDLRNAYRWYETERTGLGDEFLEELEETYQDIRRFPEGPSFHYRDVRLRPLRRFPYGVYYRAFEDHILVVGVMHLHRGDRAWKARMG